MIGDITETLILLTLYLQIKRINKNLQQLKIFNAYYFSNFT